jgi:predicted metal-dependent HD superfamily phosphohydrolase
MADNLKDKIEAYVKGLFKKNPTPSLKFHNLSHTKNVVKNAMGIAGHYNVSENKMFILYAAAWFHDTGYLFAEPQYHEKESCLIMEEFMAEEDIDIRLTNKIKQCIMATKFPQNSQNKLGKIICDADVFHFGTKDFDENNQRAFEEYVLRYGKINGVEFNKAAIRLLETHRFFTGYFRRLLNKQKEKNIIALEKKLCS